MNILCLYDATQTHTNTVFEHLSALSCFSENRIFFVHVRESCSSIVNIARFDAVCVHYSVRLPFDGLSPELSLALQSFSGLKFLFIQDEYDHTHRAWHWIKFADFQLVFTVVPERGIARVYPPSEFQNTRFVSNLTGYVPITSSGPVDFIPPSQRSVVVGYRGRPLPVRYGSLGFEKVSIGKIVREYCDQHGIVSDISWTEESRIYGPAWNEFIKSCRAMLGSESGSNVFDWDGTLQARIDAYLAAHPQAGDTEVYEKLVQPIELDGLMNQVSPRIFEAIASGTVLVLFEGKYSGVVEPNEHFIPLKKDCSNLEEVFSKLGDARYVDDMAERAYKHVIGSGKFSYQEFVALVDREVQRSYRDLKLNEELSFVGKLPISDVTSESVSLTIYPVRTSLGSKGSSVPVGFVWDNGIFSIRIPIEAIWSKTPEPLRALLRPLARRIKRTLASKGR